MIKKIISILLLKVVIDSAIISNIFAGPQWNKEGIPICTDPYPQCEHSIISDGEDGAIIIWQDGRLGTWDVYAQRVNNSGIVQWEANGVPVCTAIATQELPTSISDGEGGVIIVWQDHRRDNIDIYAQRINSNGGIQWTINGIEICTIANVQMYPRITTDGSGGAIIAWIDNRSNGAPIGDLYVQRVDSNGIVQWTPGGVLICDSSCWLESPPNAARFPDITTDGAGGAIITWIDTRFENFDVYAQRVNSSGEVQWETNGVPICTDPNPQEYARITTDGAGGAIITWQDFRHYSSGGDNIDIYVQRVNSSGEVQWETNGVPICTAPNTQEYPHLTTDGEGGAIISWQDFRRETLDVYVQRINSGGVIEWMSNGVLISNRENEQEVPQIISDGKGGAFITWIDYPLSGLVPPNIYVQQVNKDGEILWLPNGIRVCTNDSSQSYPVLISDGIGGIIISWIDQRLGYGKWDIYAQRVMNDPPIVDEIPSVNFKPGESDSSIDLDDYVNDVDNTDEQIIWEYSGNTNVNVSINSITNIVTFTSSVVCTETIIFTATDPGGLSDSNSMVVTVTEVGVEENLTTPVITKSLQNYPNPFSILDGQKTVIKLNLKSCNIPLELQIYDLSGQLVKTFTILNPQLRTKIKWDGKDNYGKKLPPGIYFCKLKGYKETKKIILMK